MLDQVLVPAVQKALRQTGQQIQALVGLGSSNAPPSELIVPPSNRATISREPQSSNSKPDWVHSVIAKAVLSLALTVVWKLSYAMKDGLLPIPSEKCGLAASFSHVKSALYGRHHDPATGTILTPRTATKINQDIVLA